MKKDIKIAVIGGDLRQLVLAQELAKEGFKINCFGVSKDERFYGFKICSNLEDCVSGCDAVITAVPCSADGKWLNCPPEDYAISVKALFNAMRPGQLLLGGRISSTVYQMAEKYCIKAIDYFDCEELAVQNAVPTSEGAIEIAVKELEVTLNGAKALVLGHGRVGKVLAYMLHQAGAHTTVAARKQSERAWCHVYGYDYCPLDSISDCIRVHDVIFNTIPALVLTKDLLKISSAVIIDLASMPGGVDMIAAKELGSKVIWAQSLPGKVAPLTAGKIILGSVRNIFKTEGLT